ncbi:MAG: hypothetical protein JW904_05275 [Spirochaetales bacterium]|nr:hypothetical protein [Spirochaetales bacterium]
MMHNAFSRISSVYEKNKNILLPAACIIITVIIAAVVRIVFLFKDDFATGFDGYYYALQVQSLFKNGEILNNDNSIVYPLLACFKLLFGDIVFANKTAVVVLCSLVSVPFFLLLYRMTRSAVISCVSTIIFSISYSQIYMSFEIVKNGISILFIVCFLFCVFEFRKNLYYRIGAAVFFILGFMTHKVTAASMIVFCAVFLPLCAIAYRKTIFQKIKPLYVALGAALLVIAAVAVAFSASTLRVVDLSNLMSQFSTATATKRFAMILTEISDIRIKAEMLFVYGIAAVFMPFLVFILRDKGTTPVHKLFVVALYVTHLVLINPFLYFSWVSMSYRLVVMSIIFASLELALILHFFLPRIPRRIVFAAAGMILLISGITLPGMYDSFHSNRYPPYRDLYAPVMKIPAHLEKNSRLITHSGMSFFIWYETGIYTEHFTPADDTGYYRLVYAFGPPHFKKYEHEPFYETPVVIQPPYYLVKESLWHAFYNDNKDRIKLVKSWQNPWAARPPFVYTVKEKFKTPQNE